MLSKSDLVKAIIQGRGEAADLTGVDLEGVDLEGAFIARDRR